MSGTKDVRKMFKQARKSLGLDESQQRLVRAAKQALGMTTAELAEAIGKSKAAVLAWLAPEGNAKHRRMPADVRMTLARIVSEHRAARRK